MFKQFWKVAGLNQKEGELQGNSLMYSMEDEADDIVV